MSTSGLYQLHFCLVYQQCPHGALSAAGASSTKQKRALRKLLNAIKKAWSTRFSEGAPWDRMALAAALVDLSLKRGEPSFGIIYTNIRSRMDLKSKPPMNDDPQHRSFSPVRIIASNILNIFVFAEMNL